MKKIGLIGGTSWVSTIDYYRFLNTMVQERLGGNESAKIILHSLNYGEIVSLTRKDDWDGIAAIICEAAQQAEQAGAGCLLLCANTMHKIADKVKAVISIPLIHVAEVTAKAVREKNIDTVLLLGTRYTMTGGFYEDALAKQGIKMLIPSPDSITMINDSIYNELGKNIFLPATKQMYMDIINDYSSAGAQGVILGCTEIPLLLKQEDSALPVFDTTLLHATAAVDFALAQ
ncbi:MAG: aspartate/glutamate racemase family protein [Chitinophagaceae bacterium]